MTESKRETQESLRALLFSRQADYQITFGGQQQARVLEDLARFCRAEESTFHADPRVAAMLDGRREVYLRIMDHFKLDPEVLWAKYSQPKK